MKKLPFLTLLIGIIFCSCDDKDEKKTYPLTFEKDYYEARIGLIEYITIRSGNQDYTVTVEDNDILTASPAIVEGYPASGDIKIYGKKKGKTVVQVTDNLTGDRVKLEVKITDTYIANKLSSSEHPLFDGSYCFYLIKNEDKDFYIFSMNQTQDKLTLMKKGNYNFSVENNTPYLSFSYTDLTNGDMTYKFNMGETLGSTLVILNAFYELGWDDKKDDLKMSSSPVYTLSLKDENTNKGADCVLFPSLLMPEGILD
ncbi:hypothetical protein D0T84_12415 [Dysgonomonas sp. 521]|uniref:hypothetical protein n=1 Tax=Dysgonomonas sp. 521 TaxID=2302932 RepID=UPI0013D2CA2B|nr:hypothetical protein [Dysgonomonas sp. 521]NDV95710.1 hypothetical protein [Dysgonomonas sp. 521]